VFLDTNILVYLYSEDELEKQSVALDIFDEARCLTSIQVLNEFCTVCLRKLKMPVDEVRQSIAEIAEHSEICHIDMQTVQSALALHEKYGYTYYDCLVLASAIHNGCRSLYSEDMQHNQFIEGKLKIVNPFMK